MRKHKENMHFKVFFADKLCFMEKFSYL